MTQERRMTIEAAGIDEALREVSEQWKLPVEELHAEVVSSEREGFLGLFGSRKVMVEVSTNAKPDIMTRGLEFGLRDRTQHDRH